MGNGMQVWCPEPALPASCRELDSCSQAPSLLVAFSRRGKEGEVELHKGRELSGGGKGPSALQGVLGSVTLQHLSWWWQVAAPHFGLV